MLFLKLNRFNFSFALICFSLRTTLQNGYSVNLIIVFTDKLAPPYSAKKRFELNFFWRYLEYQEKYTFIFFVVAVLCSCSIQPACNSILSILSVTRIIFLKLLRISRSLKIKASMRVKENENSLLLFDLPTFVQLSCIQLGEISAIFSRFRF